MKRAWGDEGVALVSAVAVSTILVLLATVVLALLFSEYRGHRRQQLLVQATWNARSGMARYTNSGQLPVPDASGERIWNFDPGQSCAVIQTEPDLVLEGRSGGVRARLRWIGNDPSKLVQESL